MRDKAPPEKIRESLAYYPDKGCFIWLEARGRVRAGACAGFLQTNNDKSHKYIAIRYDGAEYSAHRLAWWFMTGVWSEHHIDHRDADSLDNRWDNLREATAKQNMCNRKRRSDNRSGFKGVRQRKNGKYEARIVVHGKSHYLGSFPTPEAAHHSYALAAQQHHGAFSRVS